MEGGREGENGSILAVFPRKLLISYLTPPSLPPSLPPSPSCLYFHGNDLVPTREGSLQDRGLELYLPYIREKDTNERMVYR